MTFHSSTVSHSPPACGAGAVSWRLRPAFFEPVASSTRSVTRVESSPTSTDSLRVAKIDWLNATFDQPAMSLHGLMSFLNTIISGSLSALLDGGLFGFTERHRLHLRLDDGSKLEIGSIALGGDSQKGRWLLQLNGKGCGLVTDWPSLQELLSGLGATLSRVDLAVDFLDGQYTVDDALSLYESGAFINRGRNPELDTQGAWHESGKRGRTVYVGKMKNGKTLCVYEKGRQLGMTDSDWTRFEVRLGNRDREIPLDVLTNPDAFFVGAYPALSQMLDSAAEQIPTQREEAKGSIAHGIFHLQRCYGKYIHSAIEQTGCTSIDLIDEVRVIGLPRKVDPAGGLSGLQWPELQAQIERLRA